MIHGLKLNALVLLEEATLELTNALNHFIQDSVHFRLLLFGKVQVPLDIDFHAFEEICRPHALGHLILRQGFLDGAIGGNARKVTKQEHPGQDACCDVVWSS